MNDKNDFITVITNKTEFTSSFYKNSVCCCEPLDNAVAYNILLSGSSCHNFYYDNDFMESKYKITDFFKKTDEFPVLFISRDCFDITPKIINEICSLFTQYGNSMYYDTKGKLFAVFSTEASKYDALDFIGYDRVDFPLAAKHNMDYIVPDTLEYLHEYSDRLNLENIKSAEKQGVQFISYDGVRIASSVKFYPGVVIYPNTIIKGSTFIRNDSVIGPNSVIDSVTVGEDCVLNNVQAYSSVIEDNVKIGPFCHIRPGSRICSGVKIGDFVEVKNSVIGRDTHASHLTYIGDSDVGERVNFGCGSVTVNYDGVKKARCTIDDDAFIGCNTNLIAPVHIGEGAFTAAGSTVTKDVPPDALLISREREQRVIDGWVTKHKSKKNK